MNILHEKRRLLPASGPQEPITTFIMANAATIATSAAIGAVGAAVSGGNILKGALFGAITGGIAAGVSEVFAGASAASGQGITAVGAGEGLKAASGAFELAPVAETAVNTAAPSAAQAAGQASSFSIAPTVNGLQTSGLSASGASASGGLLPTQAGSGLAVDVSKTGIGSLSAAPTSVAPTTTGLLGGLSKMGESKLANTGLLIGGQMLLGSAQEKAQQEEIKRKQTNAAYTAAPVRGMYS